jgi:hypothetical protein
VGEKYKQLAVDSIVTKQFLKLLRKNKNFFFNNEPSGQLKYFLPRNHGFHRYVIAGFPCLRGIIKIKLAHYDKFKPLKVFRTPKKPAT